MVVVLSYGSSGSSRAQSGQGSCEFHARVSMWSSSLCGSKILRPGKAKGGSGSSGSGRVVAMRKQDRSIWTGKAK